MEAGVGRDSPAKCEAEEEEDARLSASCAGLPMVYLRKMRGVRQRLAHVTVTRGWTLQRRTPLKARSYGWTLANQNNVEAFGPNSAHVSSPSAYFGLRRPGCQVCATYSPSLHSDQVLAAATQDLDTALPRPPWGDVCISWLGAFLSILAISGVNQALLPELHASILVASFGVHRTLSRSLRFHVRTDAAARSIGARSACLRPVRPACTLVNDTQRAERQLLRQQGHEPYISTPINQGTTRHAACISEARGRVITHRMYVPRVLTDFNSSAEAPTPSQVPARCSFSASSNQSWPSRAT